MSRPAHAVSVGARPPEEQFNNAVNLVLGVDPIPGTTKSLVIVYRYWDTIHVTILKDFQPIIVPTRSHEPQLFKANLTPDLDLLFARYGAEGTYADVSVQFYLQTRRGKNEISPGY